MCLQSSLSAWLLCLALLVAGAYAAAFGGDSVEEGVRDKKIITLLRRNTQRVLKRSRGGLSMARVSVPVPPAKGQDASSAQASTGEYSCKLYGHSCLGGHGKRSDDGSVSGGPAMTPDVMQMLRKSADDEAAAAGGPFPPPARFNRVALLEKALVQLLRNRMLV
ncbi:neuropeptide CCHamide-2 isoform X2 [Amblyomma americanum]